MWLVCLQQRGTRCWWKHQGEAQILCPFARRALLLLEMCVNVGCSYSPASCARVSLEPGAAPAFGLCVLDHCSTLGADGGDQHFCVLWQGKKAGKFLLKVLKRGAQVLVTPWFCQDETRQGSVTSQRCWARTSICSCLDPACAPVWSPALLRGMKS